MADKTSRYSLVSIILHWLIAALIIANVFVGGAMEDAAGAARAAIFQWHKSIGMTVLILSLVRLGWRIAHPAPPLPADMARWERGLARTTHVIFYVLMIGIPLMGWLGLSATGSGGSPLFGIVPMPVLPVPESRDLADNLFALHKVLVKSIYVVIALHIAGALKHHFLDKDIVLHRMLPLLPTRK